MRLKQFKKPDIDYRSLFLENWGIKLFSLGLAITLWFYVTSKGRT